MAVDDQAFKVVDSYEYRRMMQYASRRGSSLHIPSSDTIKRRIMELGENYEEELKILISVRPFANQFDQAKLMIRLCIGDSRHGGHCT